MENMKWYEYLKKPNLNPPAWIFAPVWTILYVMIGLSLFFFVKSSSVLPKLLPIIFFSIQLFFNLIWSWLFFGLKRIGVALIDLILLVMFLGLTIITFYPISKLAAWLLIPYFLWCLFAMWLNFRIWRLNSEEND